VTLGLRLAGALHWFWRMRGHMAEGRMWLDELLARACEHSSTTERKEVEIAAPVRAKALTGAGWLALDQGDYGPSTVLHTEGLRLWRVAGGSSCNARPGQGRRGVGPGRDALSATGCGRSSAMVLTANRVNPACSGDGAPARPTIARSAGWVTAATS
jgi:hypothetical protein